MAADPKHPESIDGGSGDQMPEPTFPAIGEEDDESGGGNDTLEARLEALEKAREEERQRFEKERERWQGTIDKLIQGQAAPAPQPTPQGHGNAPAGGGQKMPEVDFSGLPDPVEKPQEYQRELSRRMNYAMQKQAQEMQETIQRQQQQVEQKTSQERKLDELWERFKTTYDDLADKQVTLNGAVAAEVNDMRARGVDPSQGIFADPDGFMEKVATRMRKELGTNDSGQGGGEGGNNGHQRPNRTKGLGGGTNAGGASGKPKKEPPGFVNQLKKAQMDSGLI